MYLVVHRWYAGASAVCSHLQQGKQLCLSLPQQNGSLMRNPTLIFKSRLAMT